MGSEPYSFISYWLNEWLQSGAVLPKIVVCDHSLALLGAIARSFGNMPDLKYYLNHCYDYLVANVSNLPSIFIRVDYAHVMKIISNWDCLKKKPTLLREFYMRSMTLLIKATSLTYAEKIIEALFVVSNSKFNATYDSNNKKSFLKLLISSHDVVNINDFPEEENENIISNVSIDTDVKINEWINNICNNSENMYCNEGEEENYHYLPNLKTTLTKFLKTILIWSSIMTTHFQCETKTASSTIVESYFNNLKNRTLKQYNLPIKIDKFVTIHLADIKGELAIAAAQNKFDPKLETSTNVTESEKVKSLAQIENSNSDESDELNSVDNWRGLAKKKRKIRTSYYGAPCLEILNIVEGKKLN